MKAYSNIILIEDYNLAISCRNGYYAHTVTKSLDKILDLRKEYEIQKSYAKSLTHILEANKFLNNEWYLYAYDSNNDLLFAIINIDGKEVSIVLKSHNNREYKGTVYKVYRDILLCTELGILKFKESEKKKIIKIISILSDQDNSSEQPIILFAILSKVLLEENDADMILSSLVISEDNPSEKASFKLSLRIDEILKPFLLRYEKREREKNYKFP